jgi:uncharacterized protein YjdB
LTALALSACARDAAGPVRGSVEGVVVEPFRATVAIGAAVPLAATLLDASGGVLTGRTVHWSVEDTNVARVAANGTVTGKSLGMTQIAASAGGRSGTAQITVVPVGVASVRVTPGHVPLLVGQTSQLDADALDASGQVLQGRVVAFSSNNPAVATVSATGLVTARAPGGAIVVATSEGKSAPTSVTVSPVPVAAVLVSPSSQFLTPGQTALLQVDVVDSTGQPLPGRTVLWSTSDPSVATVTSTGQVTGIATGGAFILAMSEGKRDSADVTVGPPPVNAVVVSPAQAAVVMGRTLQLTTTVLDAQGQPLSGRLLTYSSGNPAGATVSPTGLVTGVALGSTHIVVSSQGISDTAMVSVVPVPVTTVTITPSAPVLTIGQTIGLTATATSSDGSALPGRPVAWSSGTPAIATVSTSGVVTGVSPGSAVVFATIEGVVASVTVTVASLPVASVLITPSGGTVQVGDTLFLTATPLDANGAALTGRITSWASDNPTVATVGNAGQVAAVAQGTASITATIEGKTGTVAVTVTATTFTVTITPPTLALRILETGQLTAVVRTQSGKVQPNAPVTWSSSNPFVATVSPTGTVLGLMPGTTVITVTSKGASATATVTVTMQH